MRCLILATRVSVFGLVLFGVGCGDDDVPPSMDGGVHVGVHPRFEIAPDPMALGAIPWPDDLYLGADGRLDIGALPGEPADPPYHASLRESLRDLDGFGVVSPIFFTFDGALDPTSLPSTVAGSMLEDASVFLVDVDPASRTGLSRVPIEVNYNAPRAELAMRPAIGHALRPQTHYVAVVTRRVSDSTGQPLVPAPDFAAVRDALTMPTDPLLAEAYDHYATILATLASNGVARADVVALAVFHTQSVVHDLADARLRVHEIDAPVASVTATLAQGAALDEALGMPVAALPGLDVGGGVAHGSIGWLVQGAFPSPSMISSAPATHGRFERDAMNRIVVKRMEEVPFTLILPRSADLSSLPLVIFQHGIGEERSNVLAFADALASDGYAVVAIDAPFHGLRNPSASVDTQNEFTGASAPDGFGDVKGLGVVVMYAGIADTAGELVAFHPAYLRDALRQSVVDLYALVRLFREGDLTAIREAAPELGTLGFSPEPLAVIGNSLGGIIGTELAATEPEIGAAVLTVTGGSLMHIVAESPTFNRGYYPLLLPHLGIVPGNIDYASYHPRFFPELAVWQTLLDRGDSIAYADQLSERPVDILMLMARHDETLNNLGTEGLARAIGMPIVADAPLHTDLAVAEAPLRNNTLASGEMVSRALYVHQPATHGLFLERHGRAMWAHPVVAPFEPGTAADIDDPIDAALAQALHFLESFRVGDAEIIAPPL